MNLVDIITGPQDPSLSEALGEYVSELLPEFKAVLSEHPLDVPGEGCCSVSEAFWLYALTKSLEPEIAVESGTFEGYSSHFLCAAMPSGSTVYGFDPGCRPKYRLPSVHYCRQDWTTLGKETFLGRRCLVFFDDHLNHRRRLHEAYARGIRHALFHDNYLTASQSHIPIRFVNMLGMARRSFTFENMRNDAIFTDTSRNPQAFRWLTYVELETPALLWRRLWRLYRMACAARNPYGEF